MAEDYSDYIEKLQEVQEQRISERRKLRRRIEAAIAPVKSFAQALKEAGEIESIAIPTNMDNPSLMIFVKGGGNAEVECRATYLAGQNWTEQIRGATLEIWVHAGNETVAVIDYDQPDIKKIIFDAVIEAIAQVKANLASPAR